MDKTELVSAFLNTNYLILKNDVFKDDIVLKIGEVVDLSSSLPNIREWAFITAWNPLPEILSKEAYPIKHAMNNQSDKCLTLYEFVNEINNKELITKLYLFNQKKYFILKKINEDC